MQPHLPAAMSAQRITVRHAQGVTALMQARHRHLPCPLHRQSGRAGLLDTVTVVQHRGRSQ